MFFVIRHGQRADDIHLQQRIQEPFNEIDPPITLLGEEQAILTGQAIKNVIKLSNQQKKQIVFLSSPFIRCLQTIKNIMAAMEIDQPIFVQKELGEILKSSLFAVNPLPQLEIHKFENGFQTYFETKTQIQFPETVEQVEDRIVSLISEMMKEINEKIFILVTHARPLKTFLHLTKTENVEKKYIQYCHTLLGSLDQNGSIQWQ